MKRILLVGLLFLFSMFLVGMGSLGGAARIRVPEPARNYSASIMDQSDTSTRVEKLSFEGQTAISGKLGSGHVSIDFDKIVSMSFILHNNTLRADVLLKDDKTISVVVDKEMVCYGNLSWGGFKIAVADIRSITIHGLVNSQ